MAAALVKVVVSLADMAMVVFVAVISSQAQLGLSFTLRSLAAGAAVVVAVVTVVTG